MGFKKLKTLALGILLFSAISCCKDKDEDKLPPETQEGKNTFGCLVNGKVWVPTGITFPSPNINAEVSKTQFRIGALKSKGGYVSFNIQFQPSSGIFNLNNEKCMAAYGNSTANCYYRTDSITSIGTLEITKFDSINNIISGRFSFNASKFLIVGTVSDESCDSTVTITEGRFDIKYIP